MKNKNSKSESFIVREAENIIEKYLSNRELGNVKKYYQLKEKYEKLRILTTVSLLTLIASMVLNIFFK